MVAAFVARDSHVLMRKIHVTQAEVDAIETLARMLAGDAEARLDPAQYDRLVGSSYVAGNGNLNELGMEILLRDNFKARLYLVVAGHLPRIAPTVEVEGEIRMRSPHIEPKAGNSLSHCPDASPAVRRISAKPPSKIFDLQPPKRVVDGVLTPSAVDLRDRLIEDFGRWPEVGIIPPLALEAYERRDVRQLINAGHLEFDRGSYVLRDPSKVS